MYSKVHEWVLRTRFSPHEFRVICLVGLAILQAHSEHFLWQQTLDFCWLYYLGFLVVDVHEYEALTFSRQNEWKCFQLALHIRTLTKLSNSKVIVDSFASQSIVVPCQLRNSFWLSVCIEICTLFFRIKDVVLAAIPVVNQVLIFAQLYSFTDLRVAE